MTKQSRSGGSTASLDWVRTGTVRFQSSSVYITSSPASRHTLFPPRAFFHTTTVPPTTLASLFPHCKRPSQPSYIKMATLLSELSARTRLDLDSMDLDFAKEFGPFADCTSNQVSYPSLVPLFFYRKYEQGVGLIV